MSHSFPQFLSPSPGSWRRDKAVSFDPSPVLVPLKVHPAGFEEPGAKIVSQRSPAAWSSQ